MLSKFPIIFRAQSDSANDHVSRDTAMAFFKRELSPVERFENALIDKRAARQKLAGRLSIAETELGEVRAAAERLAVAGAPDAQLVRAEANMRAVEGRTKTLHASLRIASSRMLPEN